jgi:hypothetical protein
MGFEIRPFRRENEHVLVALAGPSGGGKTLSALRLARGLADGGKIGLIDTEMGRARHYADGDAAIVYGALSAPFSPDAYTDAVAKVQAAGASVIIVDSMSHEWQGEGGCIEMQEAELDRMAGQDWAKRERARMSAWIKPKMTHKKMMGRFLQLKAHLIFCLRAEEKVKPEKDAQGKMVIVPLGWMPICEKNFMYEMTASFTLSDTVNHLPTPIKLQEQHRPFFPLDRPISEDCGRKLAAWAKGSAGVRARDAGITEPDRTHMRSQPAAGEGDNPAASSLDEPEDYARVLADVETAISRFGKADELVTWWQSDSYVRDLRDHAPELYARALQVAQHRTKRITA